MVNDGDCYHGGITKKECEEVLGKKNKDGAYLIRESETIQGALCLCVYYGSQICCTFSFFMSLSLCVAPQTAGGLQETYFKTLADLIRNYKRKNQGLAIHLRHSVKKKTVFFTVCHLIQLLCFTADDPNSDYVEVIPD
uniref:SH2 domain-containing protein n=1 Tax=Xiphophorus couchianus TaxID=32473 RepID=A0A3B5MNL2_9TELE